MILAGGTRRSIGATSRSDRSALVQPKIIWRIVHSIRADRPLHKNLDNRTVRWASADCPLFKCQPNSVSEGSVKFSLVAGDSTVTLHGNLMKSYDPNFRLQRSLGLNSLPHRLLWDKAQNTTKNMMHARPTLKFIFIFLEKLEISHACTTLGAFRLWYQLWQNRQIKKSN